MKLSDLLKYNQIVIQAHDNPDADAVGSGFALYSYFRSKGKSVRLVYSGRNIITKSNMKMMISELGIPIEYVTGLVPPELLITVDCQHGENNVTRFEAENIAVIDHHNTELDSRGLCEIRPELVSCATLCYSMLKAEGYDVNENTAVATALYYGLYMDSKQLAEISHPIDRDMIELLKYDRPLITRLKYANYDLTEMFKAGVAISKSEFISDYSVLIAKSEPCDPNILGVISDFVIQVDSVNVCVVYNELDDGYKLSVRTSTPEVAANDFIAYITRNIGNGGGHRDKAGGYISKSKFCAQYGDMDIQSCMLDRIKDYYAAYDVIRSADPMSEEHKLRRYRKKRVQCGYVRSCELFGESTKIKLRTLEGDVFITTRRDIIIMIGITGEVYPIEEKTFNEKYNTVDGEYNRTFEYNPVAIDLSDASARDLLPHAKCCVSKPTAEILARPLEKYTKVFTAWDYDGYMAGKAGDMLCYNSINTHDVYVVKGDMFDLLYEEAE